MRWQMHVRTMSEDRTSSGFILKKNSIQEALFSVLKPDEVLTLLIAAHDFLCSRDVMVKLIRRLAGESNTVFTRLKISRFLPAVIYGAVISTSMNLCHLKEYEAMNGHMLKMERYYSLWKKNSRVSGRKLDGSHQFVRNVKRLTHNARPATIVER